MPEITLVHVGSIGGALLVGLVLGWIFRNSRSRREKLAINAGWQAQIDSQQSEHDRLAEQNKSLMEQVSQYQASNKDSKMRARELSDSLKEAFSRRDDLQRQMKDIRKNLEVAVTQRDKLKSDVDSNSTRGAETSQTLKEKDEQISKLVQELKNWQDRVPPLVERYRQRDLEAQQLEIELQKANDHIATLEGMSRGEHTRIEPVDSSSLPDGLDASNEPHSETSVHAASDLDDQVEDDDTEDEPDEVETDQVETDESEAEPDEVETDDTEDEPDQVETDDTEDEPDEVETDESETGLDEADTDDSETGSDEVETDESDDDVSETAIDETDTDEPETGQLADTSEGNGADNAESAFPNLIDDDFATGVREQDNLKEIKGVGPAIEKTLNGLGIYRFNQIAEMSEYDIDRVAQQLKGFRSRIYREDWIGQARTLQYQKNNAE
jgi:NADH-quinone oxidoreductase subunit E